ncbi:hypothetical protein [Streptomyces boluensis]|uniref:Integral membrane protein n=1 Tax=Streptomyces boluensis TaxID=1775135 RepID=A0A964UNF5_9ACTN|nr:hypothetical protein [Streptomyces boluensis]NBE52271.1 hypothetical protein [Streptomyces boluensis]
MRTARALAASAVACAAVVGAAPLAFAGETAAEVSPRTVAPGGTVTISVSCPGRGNPSAPSTITANSQAFTSGSVRLHKVENGSMPGVGPAYNGTAHIAETSGFNQNGPNGVGSTSEWSVDGTCPGDGQWSASFTVSRGGGHNGPVRGGIGGSFTDSQTTMITGGVLIVGALGYAYYRTRRGTGSAQD